MEDVIERITYGNPTAVKVVLASVVLALAAYQLALIAVAYGKLRPPFLRSKAAGFAHRSAGDAIVAMTIVIAIMCIGYFGIDDASGEETRAALHVISAILLLTAIALKIAVVRWLHGLGRYLPPLGITVFILFVLTWVTSAGDYLLG